MQAAITPAEVEPTNRYGANDLVEARRTYLEHSSRVQQIRTLFARVRAHAIDVDVETLVAQLTEHAFCNPLLPYVSYATRKEVAEVIERELDAAFADTLQERNGQRSLPVKPFFQRVTLPSDGSLVHQLARHCSGREELLGMLRATILSPGHLPPVALSCDEIELLVTAYASRTGAFRFALQMLRDSLDQGIALLTRSKGTAWTYEPQVLADLKALRALTLEHDEKTD